MVMNGEEGLECEVHVDGIHLSMPLNSNIWSVLDEVGTDGAECSMNVASGRWVEGSIRSLVNARDLQLECDRI